VTQRGAVNWLAVIAACAVIALAIVLFGKPDFARGDEDGNAYHGPANKPRWLTTECNVDGPPAANCYWNDGSGHAYWVIPVGPQKLCITYWNTAYNRDNGYCVNR